MNPFGAETEHEGPVPALTQGAAADVETVSTTPDARTARLIGSWIWLDTYGKTPADFGLAWREVDPAWRPAMLIVKGAFENAKAQQEQMKHAFKGSSSWQKKP